MPLKGNTELPGKLLTLAVLTLGLSLAAPIGDAVLSVEATAAAYSCDANALAPRTAPGLTASYQVIHGPGDLLCQSNTTYLSVTSVLRAAGSAGPPMEGVGVNVDYVFARAESACPSPELSWTTTAAGEGYRNPGEVDDDTATSGSASLSCKLPDILPPPVP